MCAYRFGRITICVGDYGVTSTDRRALYPRWPPDHSNHLLGPKHLALAAQTPPKPAILGRSTILAHVHPTIGLVGLWPTRFAKGMHPSLLGHSGNASVTHRMLEIHQKHCCPLCFRILCAYRFGRITICVGDYGITSTDRRALYPRWPPDHSNHLFWSKHLGLAAQSPPKPVILGRSTIIAHVHHAIDLVGLWPTGFVKGVHPSLLNHFGNASNTGNSLKALLSSVFPHFVCLSLW